MAYELNGTVVEHDDEGYLMDVSQWNPQLAEVIAEAEKIELDDDAWEVVNFLRQYYEQYPGHRCVICRKDGLAGDVAISSVFFQRQIDQGVNSDLQKIILLI